MDLGAEQVLNGRPPLTHMSKVFIHIKESDTIILRVKLTSDKNELGLIQHMPKLGKCSKWCDHGGRKGHLRNGMQQLYPVVDHVYRFGFRRGGYKGPTRDDDMVLLAYGYTRDIEMNDDIRTKRTLLESYAIELGLVVAQRKVWYGDMPANQIIVAHPQAMDEVSHAVQVLAQSGGLKRFVQYEE